MQFYTYIIVFGGAEIMRIMSVQDLTTIYLRVLAQVHAEYGYEPMSNTALTDTYICVRSESGMTLAITQVVDGAMQEKCPA